MSPALHSLSHVALETPDLEGSLSFFVDAVGLEETDRVGETVYLRAIDEFAHHSLSLTQADAAGVDHIGWQTTGPEEVDRFAERLAEAGLDVTRIEEGEETGQGAAVRFDTPGGHRFEVCSGMTHPSAPTARRSRLRNKPYAETTTNPIAPRRIDHVQVWDENALALADWLCEQLGFRVQEYYERTNGTRWGTFLSASGVKIELAVIQDDDPDAQAALNHVAYKVDDGEDLFKAADAMKERRIPIDGFGQHSISRGKFLYARDPISQHTIEFSAGGYLVFDPNWEPIAWREDDLEDRQWIGRIAGGPNVQY